MEGRGVTQEGEGYAEEQGVREEPVGVQIVKEIPVENQGEEQQNVVQNHAQGKELETHHNAHDLGTCSQIVNVFTTYSDSKTVLVVWYH